MVRRSSENFADRAQTGIQQMVANRLQPGLRHGRSPHAPGLPPARNGPTARPRPAPDDSRRRVPGHHRGSRDGTRGCAARRHHPAIELGVHPGQVRVRLAGAQQTIVGVHVDAVAGSGDVPGHDLPQNRNRLDQHFGIGAVFQKSPPSLDVPQGGIDYCGSAVLQRWTRDFRGTAAHSNPSRSPGWMPRRTASPALISRM